MLNTMAIFSAILETCQTSKCFVKIVYRYQYEHGVCSDSVTL